MWAEDYQKKFHEKEGEKNVEAEMTISDSECASNFFNGQARYFLSIFNYTYVYLYH